MVVAQRPEAKELLKSKFIKGAKKTSMLTGLINRAQQCEGEHGENLQCKFVWCLCRTLWDGDDSAERFTKSSVMRCGRQGLFGWCVGGEGIAAFYLIRCRFEYLEGVL